MITSDGRDILETFNVCENDDNMKILLSNKIVKALGSHDKNIKKFRFNVQLIPKVRVQ